MSAAVAISCIECNQSDEDESFYDKHQWLPDKLWCVNKSVEDMTETIVRRAKMKVRSRYGNKKRHRQ